VRYLEIVSCVSSFRLYLAFPVALQPSGLLVFRSSPGPTPNHGGVNNSHKAKIPQTLTINCPCHRRPTAALIISPNLFVWFPNSFPLRHLRFQSPHPRPASGILLHATEDMSVTSNVTIDNAWSSSLWPGVALVTGAGSGEHSAIL
jgi:hypothetical protein